MAKKDTTNSYYSPEELGILFDALNRAPAYLSKRFILKHLCNWSDDLISANVRIKNEEYASIKSGDKTWQ